MAGALEFMWRGKMHTGFWWGNTKETTWKASVQMEDNIKVDLTEMGCEGMGCVNVAQDWASGGLQ